VAAVPHRAGQALEVGERGATEARGGAQLRGLQAQRGRDPRAEHLEREQRVLRGARRVDKQQPRVRPGLARLAPEVRQLADSLERVVDLARDLVQVHRNTPGRRRGRGVRPVRNSSRVYGSSPAPPQTPQLCGIGVRFFRSFGSR
jgi:hypothetical protein